MNKKNNIFSILEILMCFMASIPVLGVIFNTLHISLDWRLLLIAIAAGSIVYTALTRPRKSSIQKVFKNRRGELITLLCLSCLAGVIYIHGSFQYPWLEDDDPWTHAVGAKYVSLEKNVRVPSGEFHYINPYPPGYDILMGIFHQIFPSLNWTLKFFNGLIICLGFLFFYAFIKEFTGRREVAFLSTFLLILTPCYLSHFIWAHSLAVTLFFPGLYFGLKSLKEDGHILPTGLCWAAISLTQPTQTLKFIILLIIMLGIHIICNTPKQTRYFKNILLSALLAFALASLWWGPVIYNSLFTESHLAVRAETEIMHAVSTKNIFLGAFSPTGGTATEIYTWKDFWELPKPNYINNPTGFGPFLSIVIIFGFLISLTQILRRSLTSSERFVYLTTLLWLCFTFLGANSATFKLPIGLFAFRFWMLLSIPATILAADGLYRIDVFLKHYIPPLRPAFLLGMLCCIALQSGIYKYSINNGQWLPGTYFKTQKEIDGYVWLKKHLMPNTKVFAFCDNLLVIGMDMRADVWDQQYKHAFHNTFYEPLDTVYKKLKEHNFEFLIVRRRDGLKFGREAVNAKLKDLDAAPKFKRIFSNEESFIFAIL